MPAAEVTMLLLLLAAEPTRLEARRPWLRPAALAAVSLAALAVFASTVKLILDLIRGGKVTDSATTLLASGFLVWVGNVLVFGLLYLDLDSGGPCPLQGRAPLPRLRVPALPEPRARAAGLATLVRRLPDSWPDHKHRSERHRRDADEGVDEADHGRTIHYLTGRPRTGDRTRGQHAWLVTTTPTLGSVGTPPRRGHSTERFFMA